MPHVPGLDTLFIVQRLIAKFHGKGQMRSPLNGCVAYVSLKRPLTEQHRVAFEKIIQNFYAMLPTPIEVVVNETVSTEHGTLEAVNFSSATLRAWQKDNSRDIVYYASPTGEIKKDGR